MAINCCHGCVAPKRHPGCHDTCPEYRKEKVEHEAKLEEDRKRRKIRQDLNEQRYQAIAKATKKKRKEHNHER